MESLRRMVKGIKTNRKELSFLRSHELGRLATSSGNGMPHVTPVIYALDVSNPVVATDYGTKKLKNLKENPKACLLVDDSNARTAVVIQGRCFLYERGTEYVRLLKILFRKFDYYRNNPWSEGESPILEIRPDKVVSWGL